MLTGTERAVSLILENEEFEDMIANISAGYSPERTKKYGCQDNNEEMECQMTALAVSFGRMFGDARAARFGFICVNRNAS